MKKYALMVMMLIVAGGVAKGLGVNNTVVVGNTFGFSWNDNYYQSASNKTATATITDSPEISANYSREGGYYGLNYKPEFVWFSNGDISRRQTLQHSLDVNMNQAFAKRFNLNLTETLRRGVMPELMDRNNVLINPDQSYLENTFGGALGIQLREKTLLNFSGRYYVVNYDEEAVATNSNYNIVSSGLSLRQVISSQTTVNGVINYDQANYRAATARSAATLSLGGGIEHSLGARLLTTLNAGYQLKSFDLTSINGQNSPYGNASITYIFDPRLRFTGGLGYSLWEADIQSYASQVRVTAYGSASYDVSSRCTLVLSGNATRGNYHADQAVVLPTVGETSAGGAQAVDGTDTMYSISTSLSYQFLRHNWFTLNYAHNKVDSDLRQKFDVNMFGCSWRISY